MFADRAAAGRRLAEQLAGFKSGRPVVLALPRGGVPVGFEIARNLDAPLDLVLVRKIGVPGRSELAAAAVVDGARAEIVYNDDVMKDFGLTPKDLEDTAREELAEIERRRGLYMAGRPKHGLEGRTAIVVDDGIATGATMRAALRGVRRSRPAKLVLAVPVAPAEALDALRPEVDAVVCLETPGWFGSVGRHYEDFHQLDDGEVRGLLAEADWSGAAARRGP